MHFTKMQGLGNDYLYVWGEVPENIEELSRKLSDRRFGVGSDGMIYISPSARADFRMRIFNADGSEAKMCGNGIRCVGKYVYDKGYTDKTRLTIETLSGIRTLELFVCFGKVKYVSVDMGIAEVFNDLSLSIDGVERVCTPVSVGNPHAVLFVEDIESVPVAELGQKIGSSELFPGGVNVEFVQILSQTEIRMRVRERGSGVTLACGTGACASAAAAVRKRLCSAEAPILVRLDGGTLTVEISNDMKVAMTGKAETVYEGEVSSC